MNIKIHKILINASIFFVSYLAHNRSYLILHDLYTRSYQLNRMMRYMRRPTRQRVPHRDDHIA